MGKTRWVVERTFAWLHQFKRLRIRFEIRADLRQGLLQLACAIICLRRLRTALCSDQSVRSGRVGEPAPRTGVSAGQSPAWWGGWDSNPRPTDHESFEDLGDSCRFL
ncbi:transposase [Streptomyces sp. NPDC051987]|uniref:transposase n=1 Tax=Streptomyces sp. NPDC051987 TaxID=3155808 RepID=UPI00344AEF25